MTSEIEQLARSLGENLLRQGLQISMAESCTGGWVSEAITMIPGSSAWFEAGFVTYSNRIKQQLLNVKAETLQRFGAVSEQTVIEMARGALLLSGANVALAISGVAGPDGGSAKKPVGTVWFAFVDKTGCETVCQCFQGDRNQVREAAVILALKQVNDFIN